MGRDVSEREQRTRERLQREDRLCAWEPSRAHRASMNVQQQLDTGQQVTMKLCGRHTAAVADGGTNFTTLSIVAL